MINRFPKPAILILAAMLLIPQCKKSEPVPTVTFMKTLGGGYADGGQAVQQTSDGGYIITGYTYSNLTKSQDIWLVKTNSSGDTTWTRTHGTGSFEIGRGVIQTSDGGYLVVGFSGPQAIGYHELLLVRTDRVGNALWGRTFMDAMSGLDRSIQQTSDGGYVMTGSARTPEGSLDKIWLVRMNSSGDTLWTKAWGSDEYTDYGNSVQQTSDGGFIIAGTIVADGAVSIDMSLIKTDAHGDSIWAKTFGDSSDEAAHFVQQTSDGGYIILGVAGSFETDDYDIWLVKTDPSGNMTWDRTYGGSGFDEGYSLQQTSDGGYIIAGYTESKGAGSPDVWLIKTDPSGIMIWEKVYGGHLEDIGWSVQQTSDGGYIVAGHTRSFGSGFNDLWLIKTDKDGNRTPLN
ncbi:hypothetical protein ACFL4K_01240 [Candidatus Neomarinimicrobiota bacterium]